MAGFFCYLLPVRRYQLRYRPACPLASGSASAPSGRQGHQPVRLDTAGRGSAWPWSWLEYLLHPLPPESHQSYLSWNAVEGQLS